MNQVIIEYKDGDVTMRNAGFYNQLQVHGIQFTSIQNFTAPIFPGTHIKILDNTKLETLKSFTDVETGFQNEYIMSSSPTSPIDD
ncbi:hypothetical protein BJ508DRAFT_416899 [Ascobolus immersus RN42]|uniref:Uncharacterized protein n=1 Tax=Ascobolus immersus RN42 TaxID=1160509 RepID=A0A3N4HVC9_ASCIM|nr:hypothetical protein BJ508DRAFT_416899 [Ascobolus immersus RN42]